MNKSALEVLEDYLVGKIFMRTEFMEKDEPSIGSVIKSIEVETCEDGDAKLFLTLEDDDPYSDPLEIYFNDPIELKENK